MTDHYTEEYQMRDEIAKALREKDTAKKAEIYKQIREKYGESTLGILLSGFYDSEGDEQSIIEKCIEAAITDIQTKERRN